jgi:MFS family permease
MTGIIISIFEVAAFIFSPIVGHYLQGMGRKNGIMYGYIIMASSTALNGVLAYIPSS